MSFPSKFLAYQNFSRAFNRIVRGSNKDYKRFYRHLFSSYFLSVKDNLLDIIEDIRLGNYEPSSPEVVFQPKKSGILRPITILTLKDLIVYQAFTNYIADRFQSAQEKYALTNSFGAIYAGPESPFFFRSWKVCYRKYNKKMEEAFNSGNRCIADFDLVSYYELIDHKLLRHRLEKRIKDQDFLNMLFKCLEKWTPQKAGANLMHGLPQGPEASAFLAECFLLHFDEKPIKDVVYLRYVDDIKLMAKDMSKARRALLRLDMASKELGLVPQAQKINLMEVTNVRDLQKRVPSHLATVGYEDEQERMTKQKQLLTVFRKSQVKSKKKWTIEDETKFKFSLARLKPRRDVLKRIRTMLLRRLDLSLPFSAYLKKFGPNKEVADIILEVLKTDPIYDFSAANFIEALNRCEPSTKTAPYRRAVHTAIKRSEEKSSLIREASLLFLGKRRSPTDALALIKKEKNTRVQSVAIHRLFGDDPEAPFKIENCDSFLQDSLTHHDTDIARFSAAHLLENKADVVQKLSKSNPQTNNSVKLLLKGFGLRARAPKKLRVLDKFFHRMKVPTKKSWRKLLANDLKNAEKKCLGLQKLLNGYPSARIMMLDTFNEVLIQAFSIKHSALSGPYKLAAKKGHHPDYGGWLYNGALKKILPGCIKWFQDVHRIRVNSDMAHAKTKRKGKPTRPITYPEAEQIMKGATSSWSDLVAVWENIV